MNCCDPIETRPFRSRRSHRKSRGGCLRCKAAKRKCDEASPRCSRCAKRDVVCEKPDPKPKAKLNKTQLQNSRKQPSDVDATSDSSQIPESHGLTEFSPDQSSGLDDLTTLDISLRLEIGKGLGAVTDYWLPSPPRHHELFDLYVTHTAPSLAIGVEELYALRTGIRHLACDSDIILNSILALAAVHQCHQLLDRQVVYPSTYDQVTTLLIQAEHYHGQSLQQARTDSRHVNRYDHVMANAALMVLYGCAWQSVRIRLMEMDIMGSPLPEELAPVRLQWISLIWAIRIAYSGLVDVKVSSGKLQNPSSQLQSFQTRPVDRIKRDTSEEEKVNIQEGEGPSEITRQLFVPIVARTWASAFEKLLERAFATTGEYQHDAALHQESLGATPEDSCLADIYVCVSTLNLLHAICLHTFPSHSCTKQEGSSSYNNESYQDGPSLDGLSNIEPWLNSYLSRVTANTVQKNLRRTIMSFIHKMPAQFLMLVHETLSNLPADCLDPSRDNSVNTARVRVQKLVLDIFAHWLVLVMLLDGVWWIGDIGAWELEGVISAMRCLGRASDGVDTEDDWWPSSMFTIKQELSKSAR